MTRRSKSPKRPRRKEPTHGAHQYDLLHEWVGGCVTTPFQVMEPTPHRPEAILWLELPHDLILAWQLLDPERPPVSFGDLLLATMREPMAGPPRRPDRIRVANAALAAEVRRVAPDIEVVVAPTPELLEILRLMAESDLGGHDATYLVQGRLSADLWARLFRTARALYGIAPWKLIGDEQALRLDIPALDVEGACVSVIGALDESLGLVIFPSLLAFEGFLELAERIDAGEIPERLGTSMLALSFERAADLPASMRREVSEHRWPVASAAAFPVVEHRDPDGFPRPLEERDVRIASACASALTAFFVKHGGALSHEGFAPICESFFDEDDLEVRFTVPYEASTLFSVNDPMPARDGVHAPPRAKLGRNDPCPCGSGRKYKKCCLRIVEAAEETARAPAKTHDLDIRLVNQMLEFAARRHGDAFADVLDVFDDFDAEASLSAPWSVYHFDIDGKTVAERFVETRRGQLSAPELEWIDAQRSAWLSVWEVERVEPGAHISLVDLLTGETRTVIEKSASHLVVMRDALLARVVDHDGASFICGVHPRALAPAQAAAVIEAVRRRLRRKTAVPVARLREDRIGRYLIACWEDAVDQLESSAGQRPQLHNTDGDDLLFTNDHFEFEPRHRAEIDARLSAIPGVDGPQSDGDAARYVFLRSSRAAGAATPETITGSAVIHDRKLRLETNSIARADALRARIEAACGKLIRYRARDHADPWAQVEGYEGDPHESPRPHGADAIEPEQAAEIVRQWKERHYAAWVDESIPALAGKTPREAVRTAAGKAKVELLLKEAEHMEARLPPDQRFDFAGVRAKLGLAGATDRR